MAYFPQINAAGVIAQRPYTWSQHSLTTAEDQPSGRRYATAWRTNPLGRWQLAWPHLTTAELATLEAFFDSMSGRFGEFTWLDPAGNLCPDSEDYSVAAWEKYDASITATGETDPFGGTRATLLAGLAANSMLAASVLPDGGGSGFTITGSVWVKSSDVATLSIGFIDSGFAVLGSRIWDIPPTGDWIRIHHTMTLATNSAIRLLIGGFGTWATFNVLRLFGAQCQPTPAPGAYARSPQQLGRHPKCRFDTDELSIRYVGPNQHSVSLAIAEYA